MTTNAAVTVWHYDEESESYARRIFERAWVQKVSKTKDVGGSKGRLSGSECKIRIPGMGDVGLSLGDYVRIGVHNDAFPKRGIDMAICEIADNRRGTSPHWRVLCE